MKDCIFCQIVRGEKPARKVYEDKDTLAILDTYPISRGHTLVIPKKHIVWHTDMDEKEAQVFYRTMHLVAGKIKKALNSEYVSTFIRGTRVPHLHGFLVPKIKGEDNIFDKIMDVHHYFQQRQTPFMSNEELDDIASRIREP